MAPDFKKKGQGFLVLQSSMLVFLWDPWVNHQGCLYWTKNTLNYFPSWIASLSAGPHLGGLDVNVSFSPWFAAAYNFSSSEKVGSTLPPHPLHLFRGFTNELLSPPWPWPLPIFDSARWWNLYCPPWGALIPLCPTAALTLNLVDAHPHLGVVGLVL